ncbi:hypothetical protein Droror1_Dr00027448, partial [Drosera rotundifolia]
MQLIHKLYSYGAPPPPRDWRTGTGEGNRAKQRGGGDSGVGVELGNAESGEQQDEVRRFETRGDLGFRSRLGEEEVCGGCGVLGGDVGERKEEGGKEGRKEESPALCVFDFYRREKECGLL